MQCKQAVKMNLSPSHYCLLYRLFLQSSLQKTAKHMNKQLNQRPSAASKLLPMTKHFPSVEPIGMCTDLKIHLHNYLKLW